MSRKQVSRVALLLAVLALIVASALAQNTRSGNRQNSSDQPAATGDTNRQDNSQSRTGSDQGRSNTDQAGMSGKSDSHQMARAMSGQKQKVKGVILRRDPDSFLLRDTSGAEWTINLENSTKVEEKKSNPFRGAKNYGVTNLYRGLNVEVEGRGNSGGALVAQKVRFTDDDLAVARSIESRVTPVEGRVGEAETRISQAEANATRLSGQLEELSAVANTARGGAKAAQDTADAAIAGVNSTNERISALDDYDVRKAVAVNFQAGKYVLSPEAKNILDAIAQQAKQEKGFVIEVAGHASSEGKLDLNRRLSQERADAVIRYLAETHNIPLRRIMTPFGYGIAQPVADNTTREGREQNRRVEVKILVSKGLTTPASVNRPATSSTETPRQRTVSETRNPDDQQQQ